MAKASSKVNLDSINSILNKIDPSSGIIADNPYSEIKEWIPTGNYLLNAQLSGSMYKGIPSGKISIFSGESSTGKSFLTLNTVREAQKKDYTIYYIDTESALDINSVIKFGIDPHKLIHSQLSTIGDCKRYVTTLLDTLLKAKEDGQEIPKIMIVVDSLSMLASEKELADTLSGSDKQDMTKPKELKAFFRLVTSKLGKLDIPMICTNHTYASIGSFFPSQEISGGCFVENTNIVTEEGIKSIQDIKVGELVLTMNGFQEVIKTFNFEKSTIVFKLSDSNNFECSYDHKFLVENKSTKEKEWKTADTLEVGEFLEIIDDWNDDWDQEKLSIFEKEYTNSIKKVYDICVDNEHNYVLGNGVITHNSGVKYSSSVTLMLSKAQLKEGGAETKTGIRVTSKLYKSRFTKEIPIKFHISFFHGMNPYVGLENYCDWNDIGIAPGTLEEKIDEIPILDEDGNQLLDKKGNIKYKKGPTGEIHFKEDISADKDRSKVKYWAIGHLKKKIKAHQLFTPEVFTQSILDKLELKISKIFELPSNYKENLDELVDVNEEDYEEEDEEIEEVVED